MATTMIATKTLMRRRTILVDDSRDFLEFVASDPHFDVVGRAYSGREALSLAKRQRPELVLMDFGIPDMSALELVRLIKALPNAPRVVVLVAHELPRFRTAVLQSGADGCVTRTEIGAHLSALERRRGETRRRRARQPRKREGWGVAVTAAAIAIAVAAVIGAGFTSWHYWHEETRTGQRERQQQQQRASDHWEKEIAKAQAKQLPPRQREAATTQGGAPLSTTLIAANP